MHYFLILSLILLVACQPSPNDDTNAFSNPKTAESSVSLLTVDQDLLKQLKTGDIIFHTSTSNQSLAIQIASESKYSHVGLIFKEGEAIQVFEAVQPVKLSALHTFIKRGSEGHFVVKRLRDSEQVINAQGISKMKELGKQYIGKPYDLRFEWSDDKIYCSELVWKIYKEAFGVELGQLQQIKDFDLSDPIVAAKAKERYGAEIPMEELIITPDRIFQSDKLVTVLER